MFGARFLLASTSEVYGDPFVNPQPESYRGNVNPIGPRMRAGDGRMVPNFINLTLRGEDITVYGDGSQTRSFCYVSDLVDGIYRLMMSDFVEPVNLGNPDEMSVLEFAERVIEIVESRSRIVFEELPVDDPEVRRLDIGRAKGCWCGSRWLGWMRGWR